MMSDFDARLRARLERLAAAVPDPQPRRFAAPVRRSTRKPRRLLLVLAASLAVVAFASVTTAMLTPRTDAERAQDEADEAQLSDDLARHLDGCFTEDEASAIIRARMDALGLESWTIRADDRISDAPCVGAGVSGDSHEVLLLASFGSAVGKAVDEAGAQLLRDCYDRDGATEVLRSALITAGAIDPQIEIGGVRGVPLDQDGYLQHFENGCVVYAGAQFDETGRYTWYLAAK
jgi:hypothetical protein